MVLKLSAGADMRHFCRNPPLIGKNAYFRLKTALFGKKRQNKFAYDLK
jgi:hypothetical protein